ncbi:MAG: hypothetical protein C0515_05135 [Novosphingobium sp.]|nr:hypothetical protein [Novosphingobium sp.]
MRGLWAFGGFLQWLFGQALRMRFINLRFLQQPRCGLTLPAIPLLARPDRTFGFDHPSETAAAPYQVRGLIRSLGGDRDFPGLVPGLAFYALLPFPNGLARAPARGADTRSRSCGFPVRPFVKE